MIVSKPILKISWLLLEVLKFKHSDYAIFLQHVEASKNDFSWYCNWRLKIEIILINRDVWHPYAIFENFCFVFKIIFKKFENYYCGELHMDRDFRKFVHALVDVLRIGRVYLRIYFTLHRYLCYGSIQLYGYLRHRCKVWSFFFSKAREKWNRWFVLLVAPAVRLACRKWLLEGSKVTDAASLRRWAGAAQGEAGFPLAQLRTDERSSTPQPHSYPPRRHGLYSNVDEHGWDGIEAERELLVPRGGDGWVARSHGDAPPLRASERWTRPGPRHVGSSTPRGDTCSSTTCWSRRTGCSRRCPPPRGNLFPGERGNPLNHPCTIWRRSRATASVHLEPSGEHTPLTVLASEHHQRARTRSIPRQFFHQTKIASS